MHNKIHTAGDYDLAETPAVGAIQPGMLLETVAVGSGVNAVPNVQPHSTAGGFAERTFANEDALQGKTKTDAYAAGDPVQVAKERSGNKGLGYMKAGSHYTIGMKLISSGDGSLKPTTGTPSQIIAIATADLDLSASGAVAALNPVRYL